MGWVGLGRVGLDWAGLGWVGLSDRLGYDQWITNSVNKQKSTKREQRILRKSRSHTWYTVESTVYTYHPTVAPREEPSWQLRQLPRFSLRVVARALHRGGRRSKTWHEHLKHHHTYATMFNTPPVVSTPGGNFGALKNTTVYPMWHTVQYRVCGMQRTPGRYIT